MKFSLGTVLQYKLHLLLLTYKWAAALKVGTGTWTKTQKEMIL